MSDQHDVCRNLRPPAPLRTAALLAFFAVLVTTASAAAPRVPLAEVRPGQTGYGLSVFSGTRPDTFQVTVLGLQTGARVGGDVILVELAGQDLALTAVARGMSGSPVYLDDGRLLGAVAFGWPGALRPIAGLTPACELDLVRDRPDVLQASAGGFRAAGPRQTMASGAGAALLLDAPPPPDLAALLPGGVTAPSARAADPATAWPSPEDLAWSLLSGPGSGGIAPLPASTVGGGLAPLELGFYALPAGRSGRPPPQGAGAALSSAAAGRTVTDDRPAIEPGSACALSLVSGDGHLGAMGTVSLVEGDRVVLMAHPFLQLGPVDLPLSAASVVTLFPSRELSFKLGSVGPPVGRVTHDLRAGLAGVLGERAATVPVSVVIDHPSGGAREYGFEVAVQPELTPQLVFWCLYNALLAEGDDRSRQLVRYRLELDVAVGRGRPLPTVVLEGAAAGPGGVQGLQSDWQAPLQMLLGNRHEPVAITRVAARLAVSRPLPVARVVALHAPASIEPGELFTVEVELAERRGPHRRERFDLKAPDNLRTGVLRLGAASARDFFRLDALRAAGLFEDRSLDAMLELLNRPRSPSDLTVALIAPEPGFTAAGRELAGLPASVRRTLAMAPPGAVRPTLTGYVLRVAREAGVFLQGDAVRDIEVRAPPRPRTEGVRP